MRETPLLMRETEAISMTLLIFILFTYKFIYIHSHPNCLSSCLQGRKRCISHTCSNFFLPQIPYTSTASLMVLFNCPFFFLQSLVLQSGDFFSLSLYVCLKSQKNPTPPIFFFPCFLKLLFYIGL